MIICVGQTFRWFTNFMVSILYMYVFIIQVRFLADARKICYALVDFTANCLKSALSARESEYMYEKIKSKYQRAKYEQFLVAQKRNSQVQEDEDLISQNRGKKASLIDESLNGSVHIILNNTTFSFFSVESNKHFF